MLATDALILLIALAIALGCLGWLAMEHILLKRDWQKATSERRSLDYQLMRTCTKFEAERQDLQQALLRSRAKREDMMAQLLSLKKDLHEALEIALAYRQMGGASPDSVLAKLRDDLSEFGHLMEQEP